MLCNDDGAANCQACDFWERFCAIDFAYVLRLVSGWPHTFLSLITRSHKSEQHPQKIHENIHNLWWKYLKNIYLQPLYCLLEYRIKCPDGKRLSFPLMPDDKQPYFFRNSLEKWRCQRKHLSDEYVSGSDRTLTSPSESLDCASNAVT